MDRVDLRPRDRSGHGRLVRRKPTTVEAAAQDLSTQTGVGVPETTEAIRRLLMRGSEVVDPATGRPFFAFRLHQFLSKGDTVYVSVEPESTRYITSTYQQRVPGQADKSLLPLGFCRECGQEYLVVSRVTRAGRHAFVPRQDADASGGDSVTGYVYVSEDLPWPIDPVAEGRLPDHWLATSESGATSVQPTKVKYLPEEVWVTPDGSITQPGDGLRSGLSRRPSPSACVAGSRTSR